jgi:hypothetical protein
MLQPERSEGGSQLCFDGGNSEKENVSELEQRQG